MAVEPRWPAAALGGLVAGILFREYLDAGAAVLVALACAATALLGPRRLLPAAAALGLLLGFVRADLHRRAAARDPLEGRDGLRLRVRGTVLESPRPRRNGLAFRFQVEDPVGLSCCRLFVEVRGELEVAAGERWEWEGRLRSLPGPPYPGGFDMAGWLGRQGIHHRLVVDLRRDRAHRLGPPRGKSPQAAAWRLRLWLLDSLEGRLTPDEHGLLAGITLGERRGLSPKAQEAFRRTGTTHLLAASGLNVGVVVALVMLLGRWFGLGPRRMTLPAAASAGFYSLLAGGDPSVVRAAGMAVAGLGALALGRRTDPLHCLLVACLGILLAFPAWLFDVGFQLSAASLVGLMAFAPGFQRRLDGLPRWLGTGLSASAAAGLGVAPVLAWHFQQVSPMSLPANLLMVPPAEVLLPVGLATAVVAGLAPAMADIPVGLCRLVLGYLLQVAHTLASLSPPGFVVRPGPEHLALYTAVALALHLFLEGRRRTARLALAAALALAGWVAAPLREAPAGLEARFVRLSRGAALWASVEGRHLLVVERKAVLPAAEEMLRAQGVARPHLRLALGAGEPRAYRFPEGLSVEVQPGAVRLEWRGFRLAWCGQGADLPLPGPAQVALVPRDADPRQVLPALRPQLLVWSGGPPRRAWRRSGVPGWATARDGPLRLFTDGNRLEWAPWR